MAQFTNLNVFRLIPTYRYETVLTGIQNWLENTAVQTLSWRSIQLQMQSLSNIIAPLAGEGVGSISVSSPVSSILFFSRHASFLWMKANFHHGTFTHTVCNRVIEGFGSVIESPNFPRPYPHNRNCTWEIRAPLGNTVNISFSHFNIEGPVANNCTYDFVRVSFMYNFQ